MTLSNEQVVSYSTCFSGLNQRILATTRRFAQQRGRGIAAASRRQAPVRHRVESHLGRQAESGSRDEQLRAAVWR